MSTTDKFSVLFICLGNRVRSVMAKAILDNKLRESNIDNVVTDSAGLIRMSGARAAENTIKICASHGLDVRDHRSQQLSGSHIYQANLILTAEAEQSEYLKSVYDEHSEKIYTLTGYKGDIDGDIHDPYVEGEAEYEKVFLEIESHIIRILPLISAESEDVKNQ